MSASFGTPSVLNPSEFIFGAGDPIPMTFYMQILLIIRADG